MKIILEENEKYMYAPTILNTGFGYSNCPPIPNINNINAMMPRTKIPVDLINPSNLFATGVHWKDIDSESYKFFPVKEPLEFTLGFTERKNEMEVL